VQIFVVGNRSFQRIEERLRERGSHDDSNDRDLCGIRAIHLAWMKLAEVEDEFVFVVADLKVIGIARFHGAGEPFRFCRHEVASDAGSQEACRAKSHGRRSIARRDVTADVTPDARDAGVPRAGITAIDARVAGVSGSRHAM
jgi:hypothetical protein